MLLSLDPVAVGAVFENRLLSPTVLRVQQVASKADRAFTEDVGILTEKRRSVY